jgi:hypothetical protein
MMELGPVGELLIECFPELRHRVYDILRSEQEFRDNLDEPAGELSPYHLYSEFRRDLLEPAIHGLPITEELLGRCAEFLTRAAAIDPKAQGIYRDALALRVFHRMTDDDVRALVRARPELKALARELVWDPSGSLGLE